MHPCGTSFCKNVCNDVSGNTLNWSDSQSTEKHANFRNWFDEMWLWSYEVVQHSKHVARWIVCHVTFSGDQKAVDRLIEKHIFINPKPVAYPLWDGGTSLYGKTKEMPLTINCSATGNVTQYLHCWHGLIKISYKCIWCRQNFELPQSFKDGMH